MSEAVANTTNFDMLIREGLRAFRTDSAYSIDIARQANILKDRRENRKRVEDEKSGTL